MPVAATRLSARSAVFTLTVCMPASAASLAARVAAAVASDALSAALPASAAAFRLLSSASRFKPAAVFSQATETNAKPDTQAQTDSRRASVFIDDLPLNESASVVP